MIPCWFRQYQHCLPMLSLVTLGCDTHYVQTARNPQTDSSGGSTASFDAGGPVSVSGGAESAGSSSCGATLAQRLTHHEIEVEQDIRYKRPGYDYVPQDERIALAVSPQGTAELAWLDNALSGVHVIPLSEGLERRGPDQRVPGIDIGGLVAHANGFALLTRREDPGDPLTDPNSGARDVPAAVLVRFENGTERFAAPLTGTNSIATLDDTESGRRDCASVPLNGRLAFDGNTYAAYFAVHGCSGSSHELYYGDKLALLTAEAQTRSGGWDWGCSISQGMRLLPEAGTFIAFCMSDHLPAPGLNLLRGPTASIPLAPEWAVAGFCAGELGSVIRLADGSVLVGWLSRAGSLIDNGTDRSVKAAPDIALLWIGADGRFLRTQQWLTDTPDIAETNLHLAPYGPNQVLVVWDRIGGLRCGAATCFGTFTGTYAQRISLEGTPLGTAELLPVSPNSQDDIAVFSNGDVAWPYIPGEERDYSQALPRDAKGVPSVPAQRRLGVARLRYCPAP